MSSLYEFTQDGVLVATASLALFSAPTVVDFIDGSYFLIGCSKGVELAEVTGGKTANYMKRAYTYSTGNTTTGIACTHQRLDSNVDFSSLNFFLADSLDTSDPAPAYLELIDLQGGALVKQYGTYTDGTRYTGLMWDGLALWTFIDTQVLGGAQVYTRYDINGGTAVATKEATSGATKILDIAFNGQQHVLVTADTVYFVEPTALTEITKSWNHGLANATGITFNGLNLFIVAD
jgi:hypothetical protein